MSSYNKLPGNSKALPREELSKYLKDFEKKLKDMKKLSLDPNAKFTKEHLKAVLKSGDELINLKNQISVVLRAPVPNNEKQIMDKLRKTAEELFKQFAELESQIAVRTQNTGQVNPHETVDDEFVEHQSLAIKNEDELSNETLLKRNEDIQQVHKDFIEVNSLFKEVANLVEVQGESLNEAEKNVDTAVKETGRANIELDSANKYQRSAKKKLVVIFIIVFVIVAILIGVVVAITV